MLLGHYSNNIINCPIKGSSAEQQFMSSVLFDTVLMATNSDKDSKSNKIAIKKRKCS